MDQANNKQRRMADLESVSSLPCHGGSPQDVFLNEHAPPEQRVNLPRGLVTS